MKTWKKIEETKRRANDVIKLKAKNDLRVKQKMEQIEVQKFKEM